MASCASAPAQCAAAGAPASASGAPQFLRGAGLSEGAAARIAALNKSHEAIMAAAQTTLTGMDIRFMQTEAMEHDARLAAIV